MNELVNSLSASAVNASPVNEVQTVEEVRFSMAEPESESSPIVTTPASATTSAFSTSDEIFGDHTSTASTQTSQERSNRWTNKSNKTDMTPQDMFETPDLVTDPIFQNLFLWAQNSKQASFQGIEFISVCDPCYGYVGIAKCLEKFGIKNIQCDDKYTFEDGEDHLTSKDPFYQILVCNPPYCDTRSHAQISPLFSEPI
jgi:hypothetical protein